MTEPLSGKRMSWILESSIALLAPFLLCHQLAAHEKGAAPAATEYEVQENEIRIPMKDGARLAAIVFMPKARKPGERFPVLMHTTPYCESIADLRDRGETPPFFSRYFARHGYVKVYVQTRGTCRSEGIAPAREYSEIETRDAAQAIDWLSRQPWSTGKVGMYGMSWSGFMAARVAMLKPPALKAIMVGVGTEDLYFENDWYWDGILMVGWYPNWIDLFVARSPEPDFPQTEDFFRTRFDHEPWQLVSLRHQAYGPYWWPEKRVDVNPSVISIPTMMIGGLRDPYRDSIPRMLEHLKVPTQAVVGYWEHNVSGPGPSVPYQQQLLRWWDHWLKGSDNDVVSDPKLTVYMPKSHEPDPWFRAEDIEGEWRAESWPPKGLVQRTLFLQPDHGLREAAPEPSAQHTLQYVASAGIEAAVGGMGDPHHHGYDDQRGIDAFSLVYDTEPLKEELAILGRPKATLNGSATAKLAHWFVRLSDVAPDGKVTMVTEGALNGAYRDDPTQPSYLEPGRLYQFPVNLHFTGWVFRPGHTVRVSVSNALWPAHWPSPYSMSTTLQLGPVNALDASRIALPVVPVHSSQSLAAFARSNQAMKWRADHSVVTVEHDPRTRTTTMTSRFKVPAEGTGADEDDTVAWTVSDLKPDQASVREDHLLRYELPGRTVVYEQVAELHGDATNFHYTARRWITENGKIVREKTWNEAIPRFYR